MRSDERPCVIAIDGPAAAGKGTLARLLAGRLGYAYLDTGLLYRAVGRKLVAAGTDPNDAGAAAAMAQRLQPEDLLADGLRGDETAKAASLVAAIPEVRAALLDFQRQFAAQPPNRASGAVLDGRDVGTVVCPDADVKLFVTASLAVRAARRLKELQGRGHRAIHTQVLQEMQERDSRDRHRAVAPLAPADDAIVIDTSELDPDAVLDVALKAVAASRARR